MTNSTNFPLDPRPVIGVLALIAAMTGLAAPATAASSAGDAYVYQIVNGYKLAVSSATVRNDMAELERVGLIVQPHTSAGRIPTDRGYRYFVTNLMHPASLSQDEQRTIRHQFHQKLQFQLFVKARLDCLYLLIGQSDICF